MAYIRGINWKQIILFP